MTTADVTRTLTTTTMAAVPITDSAQMKRMTASIAATST